MLPEIIYSLFSALASFLSTHFKRDATFITLHFSQLPEVAALTKPSACVTGISYWKGEPKWFLSQELSMLLNAYV